MFFTLLRLSLNVDKSALDNHLQVLKKVGSEDWDRLFDLSVRQGVLLLSYGGLQYLPEDLQPPRKLKLRWCVNVLKGNERYERYKSVISKLSDLFRNNEINSILIKGITIAELYPFPHLRESGDIDVYLSDKAEQVNSLMQSLGIKKESEIAKHTTFILDGIPIENHYTFFDTTLRFQKEGQLYQRMENMIRGMLSEDNYLPTNWNNIYQLHPQVAALYFIGHTFRHFCNLDMNLRQMCDWVLFFDKNRKEIDRDRLSTQITELGLEKFVLDINAFCSDNLGFSPYFMIPSKVETPKRQFVPETIMRYRLYPRIRIPVLSLLVYLFRRNNIYKKYLGNVSVSEFLLPEIKSYFTYIIRKLLVFSKMN